MLDNDDEMSDGREKLDKVQHRPHGDNTGDNLQVAGDLFSGFRPEESQGDAGPDEGPSEELAASVETVVHGPVLLAPQVGRIQRRREEEPAKRGGTGQR